MQESSVNMRKSGRFFVWVVAIAVALSLAVPAGAYAAYQPASVSSVAGDVVGQSVVKVEAKAKNVKNAKFTTSTNTIKKKALKVKKGTTKLNMKSGQGYIKFTATKSKAYSFKFSGVKAAKAGNHVYSAFVEVQTQDSTSPSYSFLTKVSTKGGKTDALWLAEKGYQRNSGKVLYRNLVSRTGKIKLAKGQDVYFYFTSNVKNTNVTLKVS